MKKTEMSVAEFSEWQSPDWDGICVVCGHPYRDGCKGNCTCLSCNAQRQDDEKEAAAMGVKLID